MLKYLLIIFVCVLALIACETKKDAVIITDKNIDALLKAEPNNVEYLIYNGEKKIKVYDYKAALADGAIALKLDPKNTAAMMVYAQSLANYANRTITDVATAQGFYNKILKIEPKNKRALIGIAATYSEQGDYKKSFSFINKCIMIDKKYRDAYIIKGSNFLALGNRKFAYSSYETAVQQDPKFYEGYLALGYMYTEDKDTIALQYYQTALTLNPKSTDAQYGIAMSHQENKKYDLAMQAYRDLLVIDPNYYFAYFNQAYIKQFYQNDIDSANIFYRKSLDLEPESVKSWHNLGLVYLSQNRPDDARRAFNKALEYNPNFALSREQIEKFR
jgi:tetratricopeptide (TPR) repeat protein